MLNVAGLGLIRTLPRQFAYMEGYVNANEAQDTLNT